MNFALAVFRQRVSKKNTAFPADRPHRLGDSKNLVFSRPLLTEIGLVRVELSPVLQRVHKAAIDHPFAQLRDAPEETGGSVRLDLSGGFPRFKIGTISSYVKADETSHLSHDMFIRSRRRSRPISARCCSISLETQSRPVARLEGRPPSSWSSSVLVNGAQHAARLCPHWVQGIRIKAARRCLMGRSSCTLGGQVADLGICLNQGVCLDAVSRQGLFPQ